MSNFDRVAFLNFLKSINLKKDIKNEEALFDFKKDSIETFVISSEKTVAIKAKFKSSFGENGKIGIINLGAIIGYIEALSDELKLSIVKNKLSLATKNTKINVVLQNSEYILNSIEEGKFKSILDKTLGGLSFELTKELILDIIAKSNVVSGNELFLKSADKKLYFCCKNTANETTLETVFDKIVMKDDFTLNLPKFFLSVLEHISKLEEKVVINFAKESPVSVSISTTNDNYDFTYIIALVANKE
jgi:hypothetical protein